MGQVEGPMTSEAMAVAMNSNAVVARRAMKGLRLAGIVHSAKGHGGGWRLTRRLDEVTLRMVYEALGSPSLFAFGNRSEAPSCLVEQAVNAALNGARKDAETLLLSRMENVTLASLDKDFAARLSALGIEQSEIHNA